MSENRVAGDGPAIEAHGLVKAYGQTRALDGIDLTVRRGQVSGFPGPDGAGKTTAIRILATLARPDGGTARVLGFDVAGEADAVRARVAVTGQLASLDEDLTGYENLIVPGRLRGLSRAASRQRADDLLAAFGLAGAASRAVAGYPAGMRRRPGIGANLIVTPGLLFPDEPATGMDPRSQIQVRELVRRIAAAGATVLPPTFASTIFVQPRTMPGWLQALVNVNPISHLADTARDLMNNTGGAGVIWSLIAIAATTLASAPLTLHLYSKPG